MDRQDEHTPLLPAGHGTGLSTSNSEYDPPLVCADTEAGPTQTTRRALPLIILACTTLFVFNVGDQFLRSPQVRIYEDIICRRYYESHGGSQLYPAGQQIPEEKCKIAPVESELALIRGFEPLFDAIPSLLAAIPMGMLADNPKIGRKPIILAALIGSLAQMAWVTAVTWFSDALPLRWVWAGSVFLVTGGSEVTNAILYTMIIDITPSTELASTFFTMQLVGSWMPVLVAPPIVSALMLNAGNWLPFSIGLFLSLCGFTLLCFAPETIKAHHVRPAKISESQTATANSETSSIASDVAGPTIQRLIARITDHTHQFIESSSFVFNSPHLIILICSLMMSTVSALRAMEMVVYYASARYSIAIAKSNLLNTVNAIVSISILSSLPFASAFLTKKLGLSSQRKDLLVARVSVIMFAIGWSGVGLAPTLPFAIAALVVGTLGSGFSGSVRSLSASYVEPHHQARLASFVALMSAVGNFVGSPLLAGLYRFGLSMGDPAWYGLPFMGLGTMFAVVAGALWLVVRLPEDGEPVIVDEDRPGGGVE